MTLSAAGPVPTIREIQSHIGRLWRVPVIDMLSRRRDRATVRARHVAIWVVRHVTLHSLPEIGLAFGRLDHSTVMHAIARVEAAMSADPTLSGELWALVDWFNCGDSAEIRRASFKVVA